MSLSTGVILSSSSHCSTRLLLCSSLEKEGMLSPPSRTLDALTCPCTVFGGDATDSARLGNQRDFGCRGPSGLAAGPLGRGGCSTSCSACRARPGPAGPGLISLSHFPSFLLARRALTRCEIVANSTEYFKSSNAVMAARQSSKAGRELGWALTSPPPPPTH